jgi:hypothetical protein
MIAARMTTSLERGDGRTGLKMAFLDHAKGA